MTEQTTPDRNEFDNKDPVDRVLFNRMYLDQHTQPAATQSQKLRLVSDESNRQR